MEKRKLLHGILPQQTVNYDGVKCQGIPAYNIDKPFHPKSNDWLGYLIELDGRTYYAMGDTDATMEAKMVDAGVGERFRKLLNHEIEVQRFW